MGKKIETDNEKQRAQSTVGDEVRPLPLASIQRALDYGYDSLSERTALDYLAVVIRHWFLVLALVGVGFGVALQHNLTATKIYRSSALVNIGTYVPPVDGPTGATLKEETQRSNYIGTQSRLLESYTIAQKVLENEPEIRSFLDRSFNPQATEKTPVPLHVLESYLRSISFETLQGTTLVQVHASTSNPEMSARLANAHVKAFIALVQDKRLEAANINIKFLRDKLNEATLKVNEAEAKRLNYVQENKLNVIGSEMTDDVFSQKYKGLIDSLNKSIFEKNAAETDYLAAKTSAGMNENIVTEQIKLTHLEEELQSLLRLTRNRFHPRAVELRSQIKATKSAIANYTKQAVIGTRERFNASMVKEQRLREEFGQLNSEQIEKSRHKVSHDALQQEVNSSREVQKSISKRLEEALINAESNQENVVLVDHAYAPAGHVSPDERSNLIKGCFLGLLTGLILAFLLDYMDNKVHSVYDLQHNIQIPVLGVVPQFSKEVFRLSYDYQQRNQEAEPSTIDSGMDQPTQLTHDTPVPLVSAPFSVESEAVRGILATLTSPNRGKTTQTILVTSGQKGDGKTTITLNLATALAQVGERTLLIDADLRLSSVYKYFNLSRHTPGLVECLNDNVDPSQVIKHSGVENLHLLLPGGPCTNPATLLRSEGMGELIELLRQDYDHILIDSPPLGPVADSLLLARHVDGVAVVVRSGETSRDLAESAVTRLRQVGATILGLILNDANKGAAYWKAGYSRYNYGNYNSSYNKPV